MLLSELFFKYIKDKHLERKGVTAEDLAKSLEQNGFVVLIDSENCDWTEKAKSGEFKREFWKCIDSTRPSQRLCQNRTFECFLFSVLVGQGFFALQPSAVLNMDLASTHSTRLLRAEPQSCIYFPMLRSAFFSHPSQRSVS